MKYLVICVKPPADFSDRSARRPSQISQVHMGICVDVYAKQTWFNYMAVTSRRSNILQTLCSRSFHPDALSY